MGMMKDSMDKLTINEATWSVYFRTMFNKFINKFRSTENQSCKIQTIFLLLFGAIVFILLIYAMMLLVIKDYNICLMSKE